MKLRLCLGHAVEAKPLRGNQEEIIPGRHSLTALLGGKAASAKKLMRAVIQRVTRAKVTVDEKIIGEIEHGLVVLLGIARDDERQDADYLADKIAALRIFDDSEGKMNLSVQDVGGAMLIVSQFTLYGDVRRGLRPSWIDAAAPEVAETLYDYFVSRCRNKPVQVATGSFRSMMQVELVNDGPVTILLDSRKPF